MFRFNEFTVNVGLYTLPPFLQ